MFENDKNSVTSQQETMARPSEAQAKIMSDAEQGDMLAQLSAADMFYSQSNFDDAFHWYCIALSDVDYQAHDEALIYSILSAECRLAGMYFNGVGTDTDKSMAFELYAKTARLGFVEAQMQVGMIYTYGDGVPQHFGLGYAWLYAALINGDEDKASKKTRKMIERKMGKGALANAKKMSEQWVDKTKLAAFNQQANTRFAFITQWFK